MQSLPAHHGPLLHKSGWTAVPLRVAGEGGKSCEGAEVTVIRVGETPATTFFFLFKRTVVIYVKEMLLFERQ